MRLVLYSGPQRPGITPPSYGDSTHLYTQPYTSVWNRRGTAWSHTGSQNMVNVYHTHTHTHDLIHTPASASQDGIHVCRLLLSSWMAERCQSSKKLWPSLSLFCSLRLSNTLSPIHSKALRYILMCGHAPVMHTALLTCSPAYCVCTWTIKHTAGGSVCLIASCMYIAFISYEEAPLCKKAADYAG